MWRSVSYVLSRMNGHTRHYFLSKDDLPGLVLTAGDAEGQTL